MIIKVCMPAPPGSRFASDAFDDQIGAPISITTPETPPRSITGALISAVVIDGGTSADLELEGGDAVLTLRRGAFSIATP